MNISFFCSSSEKLSPVFYSEAQLVGNLLGQGHELYFGGSSLGLMKDVAESAMKKGAKVIGITTQDLHDSYGSCEGLEKLIICKDLSERKKKLVKVADIILVLPGGLGTLDECFDVFASRQVGESSKKVILYNCYDFWSGLIAYLEQLYEQNMISQNLSDFYTVVDSVESLSELLSSIEGEL